MLVHNRIRHLPSHPTHHKNTVKKIRNVSGFLDSTRPIKQNQDEKQLLAYFTCYLGRIIGKRSSFRFQRLNFHWLPLSPRLLVDFDPEARNASDSVDFEKCGCMLLFCHLLCAYSSSLSSYSTKAATVLDYFESFDDILDSSSSMPALTTAFRQSTVSRPHIQLPAT